MPKKNAPETVTFAFRLSKEDREWLESTASANGVEVSQLVRMAIEALRQYVTTHDGRLSLPIDISNAMPGLDKTELVAAMREAMPQLLAEVRQYSVESGNATRKRASGA